MSTVDAAVMLWLGQILFSSQLRGALQVNRVDQKDDHVIVYLGEVRRIYIYRWSTVPAPI